jgi:hypothetical protein
MISASGPAYVRDGLPGDDAPVQGYRKHTLALGGILQTVGERAGFVSEEAVLLLGQTGVEPHVGPLDLAGPTLEQVADPVLLDDTHQRHVVAVQNLTRDRRRGGLPGATTLGDLG